MIKIEKTEVVGWEAAVHGMRNPLNSWDRSDSGWCSAEDDKGVDYVGYNDAYDPPKLYFIGENDQKLMTDLATGGPVCAKYRRMIVVYLDITAPLYWWKEFDTYKIGTVANSCSTMHKIAAKEFTLDDFSHEHLMDLCTSDAGDALYLNISALRIDGSELLALTINVLNYYRLRFLKTNDKKYWWQIIQLLPSSYNQKRTVMLNYEVLAGLYPMRKDHKLDEWQEFCEWVESLPYSEFITGERRG